MIIDAILSSARAYKATVEMSATIVRGAAECTLSAGSVIVQALFEPLKATQEIAKTCLGYYDYQRANNSFTTPEITTVLYGRPRRVRRPIPERISDGVGHCLVGAAKTIATLVVLKTYASGLIHKASGETTSSGARLFTDSVHMVVKEFALALWGGAKTAAKISNPIILFLGTHLDPCINVGIKAGTTGACLYGASYGIVHASESNDITGKIGNSAITVMCLAGAFYASGLNRLIG